MRSPNIYITIFICIVCSLISYILGSNHGYFQAGLEEAKIASANLDSQDLNPQFREYLKGRIYYNMATKFPDDEGYRNQDQWDFGTIDKKILGDIVYQKDPNYDIGSFQDANP